MRTLAAGLVLLVFAPAVVARDDDEWIDFAPKGGRFTLKMPAKPRTLPPQDIAFPGGKSKLHMFILEVDGGKAAYMAAYNDFPEDLVTDDPDVLDAALDGARDGAVKNVKGRLLSSKAIKLDKKYPGREFTFEVSGLGQARARIYLVDGRMYQVVVFGSEELVKGPDAKTYLDSFKLVK